MNRYSIALILTLAGGGTAVAGAFAIAPSVGVLVLGIAVFIFGVLLGLRDPDDRTTP